MTDPKDDTKQTIEQLEAELRSLSLRVQKLEAAAGTARGAQARKVGTDLPQPEPGSEKTSPLSVGGVAAIMSRGAVISIILLLALVLRTLTDTGTFDLKIGTMLGIGYATLLEGLGWLMYRRKSSYAPIFSISGALLLVAVVLETHAGFGSISTLPAYGFLAIAGGGMALISWQYKVAIPVNVGTMAVLLAALSLEYPDTNYFALSLFLMAVNVMAFTSVTLPRTRWLRVVVFFSTAVVMFVWGYKLRYHLVSGNGNLGGSHTLSPGYFYGVMVCYFLFYVGMPGLAIWKRAFEEKRPFDHILPTFSSAWAYLTSLMVVQAAGTGQRILGLAGIGFATCLLGLAAVKGSRKGTRSRGTTTFAFPATLLLALSFRDVSGESIAALAILSWGALSLAWLSSKWASDGVRVTSYFLQATVLGASLPLLFQDPAGPQPLATIVSMALTAGVAFVHYRHVRKVGPPGGSAYFERFDTKDVSGVVPLLVSVGTGFLAVRAALFVFLNGTSGYFLISESIVINLGAAALFTAARAKRNAEIKWVGVLVTVFGGGKVFLFDLFKVKGIPIVLSVLSFVMAATIGSWVLGRWVRTGQEEAAF